MKGQMAEALIVRADAVAVNLTSGAVSGLVGEREICDLPLNGRSFQQLTLLQPGVQAALAAGNDVVGGGTPKISINGARPEQNSFLLDGTDINNVYNKTPGSAAGVLLGVEAVLEFQVLTNEHARQSRPEHVDRAGPRLDRRVTRQVVSFWRPAPCKFESRRSISGTARTSRLHRGASHLRESPPTASRRSSPRRGDASHRR